MKGQSRLNLLRRLRSFGVQGSLRVKKASSVLGCPRDPVEVVGERRMMAELSSLMENKLHACSKQQQKNVFHLQSLVFLMHRTHSRPSLFKPSETIGSNSNGLSVLLYELFLTVYGVRSLRWQPTFLLHTFSLDDQNKFCLVGRYIILSLYKWLPDDILWVYKGCLVVHL